MRKPIFLAALAMAVLTSAAQADEWCRRDFGSRQASCHYSSLQQCLIGVRVSGGICERNHGSSFSREQSRDRDRVQRHASSSYGSTNLSRLRASYTKELGHITYHGKPACD